MASPTHNSQEALRGAFIEAMSRIAATVTVVATDGPGGRAGATVSSMVSVSADSARPVLAVCLHGGGATARAVLANRVFSVNALGAGQKPIADTFAGQTELNGEARFGSVGWKTGPTGAPVLATALLAFECWVAEVVDVGLHHVVFGEIQNITLGQPARPLLYVNRGYAAVGAPVGPETAVPGLTRAGPQLAYHAPVSAEFRGEV